MASPEASDLRLAEQAHQVGADLAAMPKDATASDHAVASDVQCSDSAVDFAKKRSDASIEDVKPGGNARMPASSDNNVACDKASKDQVSSGNKIELPVPSFKKIPTDLQSNVSEAMMSSVSATDMQNRDSLGPPSPNHRALGSADSSMAVTPSASFRVAPDADGVPLQNVLDVLEQLLSLNEVKCCIEILQLIAVSPLAHRQVMLSPSELQKIYSDFISEKLTSPFRGEGMELLMAKAQGGDLTCSKSRSSVGMFRHVSESHGKASRHTRKNKNAPGRSQTAGTLDGAENPMSSKQVKGMRSTGHLAKKRAAAPLDDVSHRPLPGAMQTSDQQGNGGTNSTGGTSSRNTLDMASQVVERRVSEFSAAVQVCGSESFGPGETSHHLAMEIKPSLSTKQGPQSRDLAMEPKPSSSKKCHIDQKVTAVVSNMKSATAAVDKSENADNPPLEASNALASDTIERSVDSQMSRAKTFDLESEFSSDMEEETSSSDDSASNAYKKAQTKMIFHQGLQGISEEDADILAKSDNRFILSPNCNGRMAWDFVALILIIFESVTIPLDAGFDISMPEAWMWVTMVWFTFDMFLNCITGYYSDGLLVMRQRLILKHYLRTFFLIDFVSTVPWEYVLTAGQDEGNRESSLIRLAKFGKMVRCMRLLRVVKIRKIFSRLEDIFQSYTIIMTVIKLMLLLALLCHWTGCIWGFIGDPTKVGHPSANLPPHRYSDCSEGGACEPGMEGSPWQRRYGFDQISPSVRYIAALHFATGLVTGGELDISPGFWLERAFIIFMMNVSFLVCSSIISHIVAATHKINQEGSEFKERMRSVREFMTSRKLPLNLQIKVRRYLEYQFRERKNAFEADTDFMNRLSPWLRLELTQHLHMGVITRHPFFQKLPARVLTRVCSEAKTVIYAPGDLVVQRNQRASCMCFIVRGKLRVLRGRGMAGDQDDFWTNDNDDAQCRGSRMEAIRESNAGDTSQAQPRANGNSQISQTGNSRKLGKSKTSVYLTSPSWIGDLCLFKDIIRSNTVVAVTHAELLTVYRDTIVELIAEFPKLLPYYKEFQEKVVKGDLAQAGVCCSYCGGMGHAVMDCLVLQNSLVKDGMAGNPANQQNKAMSSWSFSPAEHITSGRGGRDRSSSQQNKWKGTMAGVLKSGLSVLNPSRLTMMGNKAKSRVQIRVEDTEGDAGRSGITANTRRTAAAENKRHTVAKANPHSITPIGETDENCQSAET